MRLYLTPAFAVALGMITLITGCDDLTATTEVQSFMSHSGYQFDLSYPNQYHDCWTIEAPYGYDIKIWTDYNFRLETSADCEFDYLKIECGLDGYDGFVGKYCGHAPWSLLSSRYVSGSGARLQFRTDSSVTNNGFRIYYQAVADAPRDDCDSSDSDESDEGASAGEIAGIVIGIIFGIVIIIGVIVAIVACICCGVAASASNRRPANYVTTYPMQSQSTAVVVGTTGVANTAAMPTSPTPAQQYLPPTNVSVPPPSNASPAAPPAFGSAPPAYENVVFSNKA